MEVRTRKPERSRGLILALVLAATATLAGCSSSPETVFEWGVNDQIHRRPIAAYRQNKVHRQTAYRETTCNYPAAPADTPEPRPRPAWYQDSQQYQTPQQSAYVPPSDAGVRFAWPVDGKVISDFGSTAEGGRNDGINIAAAYGDPIRASADGTVSYAGNDLKSYGNLVLIRHGGDYVTAYAHAERIVVSRGDHVARGQIIAYAGNTGDVSRPQLHFEIRRGVKPVNPRPLLGPLRMASR